VKRATTLVLIGLLMIGVPGIQASALSPAQQTQTVTLTSDQEVAVGYNANLDEKVAYVGSAAAPPTPAPPEIKPAIVKWANPQEVLPGQDVTFTIQATNHGRDAPIDVVITDVLSEHLEILEATTTQGTVEISGQTVTANVGVIGQNFVVEVVIRVHVREDAPVPSEIENTALFRSPNGGEHRTAPAIVTVSGDGPIKLPVTGSTATRWGMLVVLAVVLIVVVIELRPGRHTFGGD
jgi:uncharacterized repeat protein (TIGR01451 family)